MAQPAIQTSFASGEWAPKLRSRVDVQKYRSGAALLRNFYIDYSGGGASTRQGTKFINQCKSLGARLIPFQPSTTISYELEFGQNYIRFYSNGSPILETATTIAGITQANPGVVHDVAHGYATGDWVFLLILGMAQLNANYYIVVKIDADHYSLTDLNGNVINTTTFGAFISGTAQRVYTITSPYAVTDLFPNPLTGNPGIKFVQDVTSMIICHPSYQPQILTIVAPANWTLSVINFGATIGTPATPTITSTSGTGAGWNYAYLVTALDINNQESPPSVPGTISNIQLISSAGMTNKIAWTAVPGAVSYNVYKASPALTTAIQSGAPYGFIGNCTDITFLDAFPGIDPDFSQTPPIPQNPFQGAGVQLLTLTGNDNYTTIPSVIIAAPPAGGYPAQGLAAMQVSAASVVSSQGVFQAGNIVYLSSSIAPVLGVVLGVGTVDGFGNPLTLFIVSGGNATGAGNALPSPGTFYRPGTPSNNITANLTWDINTLSVTMPGAGYTTTPGVSFSSGAATATATLFTTTGGNPGVPGFLQQRLMLANQTTAAQSYNLSQPGSFFNYDTSNPSQDDDAISGTIIAEELNDIRNLTPVPTGMIAFTGKGAWLINGGGGISTQVPITPSNQTAQPQGFNGANDMRPIKINMDALYVTNKGNYVRDLTYNLYAQIFTGRDISVISNHLFFNYYMLDWAWSEEPFKTLWCVRGDGQLVSLGFVKDEIEGWSHHDTNGQFKSVCSVIENVNGNIVDAVYFIVERIINGNTVQYVERMADRYFTYGYEDAWSVDCALQTTPYATGQAGSTAGTSVAVASSAVGPGVPVVFSPSIGLTAGNIGDVIRVGSGVMTITAVADGAHCTVNITQAIAAANLYTGIPFVTTQWTLWLPVTSVSGLTQLIGQSVVGVADGVVVGPFVVSATGSVALGLTASKITLGLAYLPQLQTLPLDLGEPTVQGKRKKITGITVRVADTLGISIGRTFAGAKPMKDFTLGNVPTTSTGPAMVTGLVSGDGRTIIDTAWDEAGNYCIQQNLPYPATILGAFPEVSLGDTK
jgi:hypothetical protein